MFKLFKLTDSRYAFLDNDGVQIEGDETDMITTMLLTGVDSSEILKGMQALVKDDIATYGINLCFIHSEKVKKIA
jgi:hypothetical protein